MSRCGSTTFDVVILGAGPAGLSAAIEANRQGATSVLLEAADTPGGLTRSFQQSGYTFDCSGHLLHLSDPEAIALVERATSPDAWNRLSRKSSIFLGDRMIPYPFQLHLAHAPEHIRRECLDALPKEPHGSLPTDLTSSFEHWIDTSLGNGIGRHFMVPYNEKLSTVRVSELTCEWLGRFVPQPSLDDIRLGAETRRTIQTGYNRSFLYPAYGGIATLSAGLAQLVPNLVTQARATAINTRRRTVSTDDGRTFGYDKGVIATLPLPELASIVTPTDSCFDSRTDLRANVVTCVNVGLQAANPKFSQYQWVYLPERQFAAYRIGFYARFAASMAPKGREGLYVEIAHGPHQDEAEIVERALADLLALGVTDNLDSVDTVYPVRIGCAYVIHDSKTSSVRTALHDALVRRDIWVAGRYARWEYSAMEDAIVSGLQAARRALQATPSRGGPT